MDEIRINEHGMTQCRGCHQWVRVAERLDETSCPFCGEHATHGRSLPGEILDAVRGALTARRTATFTLASFAMTIVVSCVPPGSPVYGAPAPERDMDEEVSEDMAQQDMAVMPAYGVPADMGD